MINSLNATHVERKIINQQNVLKVVINDGVLIVNLLYMETKLAQNQKIKQTKQMILQMSIPLHLK